MCVISPPFVPGERIQALFPFTGSGFQSMPGEKASVWTWLALFKDEEGEQNTAASHKTSAEYEKGNNFKQTPGKSLRQELIPCRIQKKTSGN